MNFIRSYNCYMSNNENFKNSYLMSSAMIYILFLLIFSEQSHKIGTTRILHMKKLGLREFGRFAHDHQAIK